MKLQNHLGIPKSDCMWTDYYGKGNESYGGLAACIWKKNSNIKLSRKRKLNLPPNWKYIFVEILKKKSHVNRYLNFLTLHVAPPKINEDDLKNLAKKFFKKKAKWISEANSILKRYEKQVGLQGKQIVNALSLIKRFKDPTIIAGDFNSTRDSALHVKLRQHLMDTWAKAGFGIGATRYWADLLPLRIDYIYVTNSFEVHSSNTISSDCSDHLPLVSTVSLSNGS